MRPVTSAATIGTDGK